MMTNMQNKSRQWNNSNIFHCCEKYGHINERQCMKTVTHQISDLTAHRPTLHSCERGAAFIQYSDN